MSDYCPDVISQMFCRNNVVSKRRNKQVLPKTDSEIVYVNNGFPEVSAVTIALSARRTILWSHRMEYQEKSIYSVKNMDCGPTAVASTQVKRQHACAACYTNTKLYRFVSLIPFLRAYTVSFTCIYVQKGVSSYMIVLSVRIQKKHFPMVSQTAAEMTIRSSITPQFFCFLSTTI